MIEDFKYITEYIQNNLSLKDTNMDKSFYLMVKDYEKKQKEDKIPIITREVLKYLLFMLDLTKSKNVLEIGTATGYSSIYISKNVEKRGGKLTTLEIDNIRYKKANEVFKKLNLKNITSINMDALEYLDNTLNTYDFIFIDAQKGKYEEFIKKSYNLLEKDGLLFIDNILFRSLIGKSYVDKKYRNMVLKMTKLINKLLLQNNCSILPFGDGVGLIKKED